VAWPGAAQATAAAAAAAQPTDEIVIYGQRLLQGVTPERQLDQDSISGYAASTVDELLGEIQSELGEDGDQPLIFVNGERINDISEIAGLPVEVLRQIQVLPRGSAVRAGGRSGQRVISLTLGRQTRAATITVAPRLATDGDWRAGRGEGIFTHVRGDTRANLSLRTRQESGLLESDRDIVQPEPRLPFAIGGQHHRVSKLGDRDRPTAERCRRAGRDRRAGAWHRKPNPGRLPGRR
jgi:hypothetical protein